MKDNFGGYAFNGFAERLRRHDMEILWLRFSLFLQGELKPRMQFKFYPDPIFDFETWTWFDPIDFFSKTLLELDKEIPWHIKFQWDVEDRVEEIRKALTRFRKILGREVLK